MSSSTSTDFARWHLSQIEWHSRYEGAWHRSQAMWHRDRLRSATGPQAAPPSHQARALAILTQLAGPAAEHIRARRRTA